VKRVNYTLCCAHTSAQQNKTQTQTKPNQTKKYTLGLFQFAAIVNVNLAAVNLLPLPGLDGGYLALLALEAARGRKLPAGLEAGVMAGGLLVMTALGVGLVIRDTINLL
jgi:membrane-associated protease RseP (regulator of RpoE activity)